jgi:hypothetical protein
MLRLAREVGAVARALSGHDRTIADAVQLNLDQRRPQRQHQPVRAGLRMAYDPDLCRSGV